MTTEMFKGIGMKRVLTIKAHHWEPSPKSIGSAWALPVSNVLRGTIDALRRGPPQPVNKEEVLTIINRIWNTEEILKSWWGHVNSTYIQKAGNKSGHQLNTQYITKTLEQIITNRLRTKIVNTPHYRIQCTGLHIA